LKVFKLIWQPSVASLKSLSTPAIILLFSSCSKGQDYASIEDLGNAVVESLKTRNPTLYDKTAIHVHGIEKLYDATFKRIHKRILRSISEEKSIFLKDALEYVLQCHDIEAQF